MKNILLGTTGLIGAALLAAAASAETPKVTVGGFIDFQGGYVDEDLDADQREYGFRNDSEISVRVDGKSDNGLGYGAVIDLEADVTADSNDEGLNASRTYVYMDGGWGRFELGSNQGAASTMAIDADNIAAATGGINGDWVYFANIPASGFLTTPALPGEHGSVFELNDESTDNANKVTYYSPRFSGFQLGLSYTPDLDDRGQDVARSEIDTAGDVFDLALNWEGNWDAVTLGAAATALYGDGGDASSDDLEAYQVGAVAGFSGFSVAGSWGDWNETPLAGVADAEAEYYTLGAAYEGGPFAVSATYLDSETESVGVSNDFENIVLGADYKLAPGLTPYAELSFYEFDADAGVADNDGTLFILGTQLAF